MDVTRIISPLLHPLVWFLPLLLLLTVLKTPWAKGLFGELLVRWIAHRRLNRHEYLRLHDLTLDTADGTTQIDHLFVSRYGLFVLETKHLRGWIFGSERQAQWTQKIYRRTFKFQNPIHQNFKHLKALEATLGIDLEHLHSVITFVGDSTFKTALPANVTQGAGFVRYIKRFGQPVFSAAEVQGFVHTLQAVRRAPTRATRREHVAHLKRKHRPKTD